MHTHNDVMDGQDEKNVTSWRGGGETFYEKTIFVVVKKYRVVT
jgi:hypothetical protein